jgi:hypothetical protein
LIGCEFLNGCGFDVGVVHDFTSSLFSTWISTWIST